MRFSEYRTTSSAYGGIQAAVGVVLGIDVGESQDGTDGGYAGEWCDFDGLDNDPSDD